MWPYLAKVLDSAPMAMVPIILFLAFSSTAPSISASDLPPVILVPGFLCSQLESTVSANTFSAWPCSILKYAAGYFHPTFYSWMSPTLFIPLLDRCSVDLLVLNYNNMTRKTTNLPGIETKAAGFGDPLLTEYLVNYNTNLGKILSWVPILGKKLKYFADIANRLVSIGYERNKSLRAAPYDFRRGPNESQEYFKNLKNLVEETYRMNGNRKIVFLVHSYGGPMTLSFLDRQTEQWKDKYIRSMISLSAVFGGTMKTIQQDVTGDFFRQFIKLWLTSYYYSFDVKKVIRTWPSVAFMMPNSELWGNRVLVSRPHKNYTASDLNEFFEDLGEPNISEMLKDQQRQRDVPLEPPSVEYHCLYSTTYENETTEMLTYDKPWNYPGNPGIVTGPGDLLVNERSLEYCKKWTNRRGPKVHVKKFQGLNHMEILKDESVLNKIQNILQDYASEDVITKR